MDDGASSSTASSSTELDIRTSARGWHGVQLAVLGFIGLCGVLQRGGDAGAPRWLQIAALLLALVALVLSCVATLLVASVAWPLYGSAPRGEAGDGLRASKGAGRRLRVGIGLTYLAVALLALGSASSWWPHGKAAPNVEVTTASSGVVCGAAQPAGPGLLGLVVDERPTAIEFRDVVALRLVDACE